MKKKKWILGIISTMSAAILGVGGYYGYHIYKFTKDIQAMKTANVATETWAGGRVNILLMGGDARPGETSDNSDSMILLSMDPKTKKAELFSIMRDTWWKIPGHDYEKINAGNLMGGPELAVQTVENFLDIPINYYVETNFVGFQKIIDVLGGVDINVDENMNYDDPTDGTSIHLKKGEQHLDGKHALDFARFRHDAMGDFNRTKHQRELLQALALKADSTIGLLKLPQVLDTLAPYVQTNMDTVDMIKLASLMHGIKLSNLQTAQVPPMNDILQRYLPQGGDVLIPNVLATRQFVHKELDMSDQVTATAEEQYYWNQYKNGNPTPPQTDTAVSPQPVVQQKATTTTTTSNTNTKTGNSKTNTPADTTATQSGTGTQGTIQMTVPANQSSDQSTSAQQNPPTNSQQTTQGTANQSQSTSSTSTTGSTKQTTSGQTNGSTDTGSSSTTGSSSNENVNSGTTQTNKTTSAPAKTTEQKKSIASMSSTTNLSS